MSQGLQTITITGHVGHDPELRATPSGQNVLDINVGTSVSRGKNKETQTNWYTATFWGTYAESLAGYVRKGMHVAVTGTPFQEIYQSKTGEKMRVKIENPQLKTLDKASDHPTTATSDDTSGW